MHFTWSGVSKDRIDGWEFKYKQKNLLFCPFSVKGNTMLLAETLILMGISRIHMIRMETQRWSNMLMSEIPVLHICLMMGIIQHMPWVRLTQLRARRVHYLQDFAIPFAPHRGAPASLCHWALPANLGLTQISPMLFCIMPFALKTAILKARLILLFCNTIWILVMPAFLGENRVYKMSKMYLLLWSCVQEKIQDRKKRE